MSRVPDAAPRIMEGATADADGVAGYVPTPTGGNHDTEFLRKDGQWAVPAGTGGGGGGGGGGPVAISDVTGLASALSGKADSSHNHAQYRKTITQAAHGFSAKQAVYDNNGTWALAKADSLATCRAVWVVESSTTNAFVAVGGGDIAVSGWAANTVYYLSAATAGLLDTTPPTASGHFVVAVVRTGAAATGRVLVGEPLSLALIPDNALANAGTAKAVRKSITQASHGFIAKQAVYDNSGTWALAKADALGTSRGLWVVESVTDSNSFVAVKSGDMAVSGWAANTVYYLSAATAGLLTTTPPSTAGQFVVAVVRTGAAALASVEIGEPLSLALIPNSALASDAARPPQVSGGEITAGSSTSLRSYAPADIVDFIDQHAAGGGGASYTTGMSIFWPRALSGSIPAGWMECDGNNGTDDQADVGALMVIMKHGGTVATPAISPSAGTYSTTQSVTITCATAGATIKYTTNGSTPSRSTGTTYSGAISVSSTQTVKAIAYKDYSLDSAVASSTFTISLGPTLVSWTIENNGIDHTLVWSAASSPGTGSFTGLVAHMSGGDVTLTSLTSGSGTTTWVLTGSRTVINTETETGSKGQYTQPGNGIEATSGGADVTSFSGATISNTSTATGGGGTPSLIASTSSGLGANGGTSSAINTTGANLIVIAVAFSSYAPGTGIAPTDSKGNTWTGLTVSPSGGANWVTNRLFYCYGATVGTGHTFSFSHSSSYSSIAVVAFSNVASSPFDQQSINAGNAAYTSINTGSITPSQANTLAITSIAGGIDVPPSIGSGYTLAESAVAGSSWPVALAYKVLTATTAQNPTWSWTTAGEVADAIANFKY